MRAPDHNPDSPIHAGALVPSAADAADRLATITTRQAREFLHELSNLIDGSLRSVKLAQRDIAGAPDETLAGAARRLEAAAAAMLHMVDLIKGLQQPLLGLRASGKAFDQPRPLSEAIAHAVEVLRPLASERNIQLELELAPSVGAAPPFPVYAAVVNAVRNAIEAIGRHGGAVRISAETRPEPEGRALALIEICDDGPGPSVEALRRAFEFGFSNKEGASGVGLALAKDIIAQAGGSIELRVREPGRPRPGASLRIALPFALPGGRLS